MDPQQPSALMQLLPLILITIPFGLMARALAKEKGRNVTKWTVLGFIPGISFFAIYYFVGAANLKLERKLDELLLAQGKRPD
jgi:hypothetical protein